MAKLVLAVAAVAIEAGTLIYSLLHRAPQAAPIVGQISSSANGSPIPFGYGTVRIAGEIIWSTGISFTTHSQSGKGGPIFYDFFASFAVALGEGPLWVSRIWADTHLIYVDPGTTTSEYPVQDFPPWSATTLYNPDNVVGYNGQVYQALVVNTGVTPGSDPTKWQLISDYPQWSNSVDYNSGDVVLNSGTLWVANASSLNEVPGNGDTTTVNGETVPYWVPLAAAYPQPTFYPGDEAQLPDPTIQAVEGLAFTPAYRGVGYCVFENLPLTKFGNRVPNLRAEVKYLKAQNVL
jgi:hypothetical protein